MFVRTNQSESSYQGYIYTERKRKFLFDNYLHLINVNSIIEFSFDECLSVNAP